MADLDNLHSQEGTGSSAAREVDNGTQLFDSIASPDLSSADTMGDILSATPRGLSLGRVGQLGASLAGWHHQVPPRPIAQARAVIFAGDHAIASQGISAYAPQASVEQFEELQAGGGSANTLARAAGASIRLVDISLDRDVFGDERVLRSCPPIDAEDAMTPESLGRALGIGKRIADQEVDAGADIVLPGELGVGNTTVAAAVVGTLTHTEPVAIVGPGSGINDDMWKRKVSVIRDAMFRARDARWNPAEVLRRIGAPDFAALVGFIAQSAVRRTPILLDGAYVSAAALVAEQLAPGVKNWCIAASLSPEPAHVRALGELELTPLVALEVSTGQAVGSLMVLPLVANAAQLSIDEFDALKAAQQ